MKKSKEVLAYEKAHPFCEVLMCCRADICAHHVVSVGANGSDQAHNLVNLCRYHHAEVHRGWFTFTRKHTEFKERFLKARELEGKL